MIFKKSYKLKGKGGIFLKDEEKKPTGWEMTDPKPPVIRSGHMDSRKK